MHFAKSLCPGGLQNLSIFAEKSIFPYFQMVSCKNPATLKIAIHIIQICTCRTSEKVPKTKKFCSDMRTIALSKWMHAQNGQFWPTSTGQILCPKEVHSCNFIRGLLHVIIYLPANMEAKRSLEGFQIATHANTGGGGNMITRGFFGQIFSWCNLFTIFIPKKSFWNSL